MELIIEDALVNKLYAGSTLIEARYGLSLNRRPHGHASHHIAQQVCKCKCSTVIMVYWGCDCFVVITYIYIGQFFDCVYFKDVHIHVCDFSASV